MTVHMPDRQQGSQRGFLLDNEKQQEEHTTAQNRMGDVFDHDDETILLVSHHDEQPIRRQLDKVANDGQKKHRSAVVRTPGPGWRNTVTENIR